MDLLPVSTVLGRPEPVLGVAVDAVSRRIELSGDLDLAGVHTFSGVAGVLTASGGGGVVVDLQDLRFIDAAGLGALVGLRVALARDDQELHLLHASERVTRVFDIGGLSELLD